MATYSKVDLCRGESKFTEAWDGDTLAIGQLLCNIRA